MAFARYRPINSNRPIRDQILVERAMDLAALAARRHASVPVPARMDRARVEHQTA